jgi:hypothetical protein
MQIRVIENNDNEGEKFSYILDVTPELAQEIQNWVDEDEYGDVWDVELNTKYTKEEVDFLNKHVDNGYMDYIGFYEIPEGSEISEETFYKGAGLNRL